MKKERDNKIRDLFLYKSWTITMTYKKKQIYPTNTNINKISILLSC